MTDSSNPTPPNRGHIKASTKPGALQSKIEWSFLNPGGIGSGFTWAVTAIEDASVGIRAN